MVSSECKAKDRANCPHHSNKGRLQRAMNKIDSLFAKSLTSNIPTLPVTTSTPKVPYTETSAAFYKGLIHEEKSAVSTWVSGEYKYINEHFRQGGKEKELPVSRWNNVVYNLNKLLKKYPDVEARPLYRGIRNLPVEFGKMKPGAEFTDQGFMSTTDNINIAKTFTSSEKPIILSITTKKGLPVSDNYGAKENEYLLARGSKFKVTKIRKNTMLPSKEGYFNATVIEIQHLDS
jgi:hypothetical protein